MTDYIEEMMKMAGVEKRRNCEFWDYCPEGNFHDCSVCKTGFEPTLPTFTAEKQLEIIKLIGKYETVIKIYSYPHINGVFHWYIYVPAVDVNSVFCYHNKDFTQALAQLTTELIKAGELDKEKVKEVLEG